MVHTNFPAILSKMFQKSVVLTFLAIPFRKWTLMLDFKCNFLPRVMIFKKKPKYESEPARRVLQASVNFFCDIPPDKVVLNNPLCLKLPWFDD